MKKIFLVTVLCLFLYNCTSSDSHQINQITQKLQGKWQLVQILYYDFQDPTNQHYVTDGYTYEFKSNGTFLYKNPTAGATGEGNYTVSNDSIINFTYIVNNSPNSIVQKKVIFFENNILKTSYDLTATYNHAGCDEGCGESFKKNSN